ncbi:hypothetical protein BYT27DRAFT_7238412 [Phlegmacium glaucopus]|nr:hypothetical protein BYT27DRAFT_7238412 [Phlegmacium glaucopus]
MTSFSTMSIKRFIFVLLLSLLYGSMVMAAPLPLGADEVHPGHVLAGRPKHLDPPGSKNAGKHPLVVLSHPDANGHVKVADLSHDHPAGSNTRPATDYGLPAHEKDGKESHISLNTKTIHHSHLSQLSENHSLHGHAVTGDNLTNLQSHTGTA